MECEIRRQSQHSGQRETRQISLSGNRHTEYRGGTFLNRFTESEIPSTVALLKNWTDIPILLETNRPTYSVHLPTQPIETLGVKEVDNEKQKKSKPLLRGKDLRFSAKRTVVDQLEEVDEEEESDGDMGFALFIDDGELPAPALATNVASVHSQGAVSTTYKIPGLATIPCDNKTHNITIVELDLDATLSWITVPKMDARAYLQVKRANSDCRYISEQLHRYRQGSRILVITFFSQALRTFMWTEFSTPPPS